MNSVLQAVGAAVAAWKNRLSDLRRLARMFRLGNPGRGISSRAKIGMENADAQSRGAMPMIKKAMLYAGGLMVAAGGPVTLFSGSDLVSGVKQRWLGNSPAAVSNPPQQPATAEPVLPAQSPANASPGAVWKDAPIERGVSAESRPSPTLAEAFRFDVTVNEIMQRWPRVSTGLPHLQLQGYRVPLVTGSRLTDVAGSLTYFFNVRQQVQQIAFRGTTGDPSELANYLARRFHFVRRLTEDPGVVLFEAVDSDNQPAGSLKIQSAKLIQADRPYSRYELDLVIHRPRE